MTIWSTMNPVGTCAYSRWGTQRTVVTVTSATPARASDLSHAMNCVKRQAPITRE